MAGSRRGGQVDVVGRAGHGNVSDKGGRTEC